MPSVASVAINEFTSATAMRMPLTTPKTTPASTHASKPSQIAVHGLSYSRVTGSWNFWTTRAPMTELSTRFAPRDRSKMPGSQHHGQAEREQEGLGRA